MSRPFDFGPIPDGWRETKLRVVLTRRKEKGRAELPLLSVNLPVGVTRREEGDGRPAPSEDLSGYQVVHPGDLVMNQLGKPHGALGVSSFDGIISPAYFVAATSPDVSPRYIHYLLRTRLYISEYERRGKFMPPNQFDISWDQFRDVDVILPPLCQQQEIAGYLDKETTRIDALIEKKRRMIEILEERLNTHIRTVLTTIDCPVVPLKRFWRVVDCKHRTPNYLEDGVPVVSPGDATPGRLDLSRAHRFVSQTDFEDLAEPPRRPQRGDIIYSRNASIGIAAYVDTDQPFCMGQDVCLISSTHQNQLYLTYVLNTLGVDQLDEQKIGSTFSRVNIAQIVELSIPTPEVDTQSRIAEDIDRTARKHSELIGALTRQIDLLSEHRSALITAAVTGQLMVERVTA